MKLLNSKTDKFLLECIEIDLYDILNRAQTPQPKIFTVRSEASTLLWKYIAGGFITDFDIISAAMDNISVRIYAKRKTIIRCQVP